MKGKHFTKLSSPPDSIFRTASLQSLNNVIPDEVWRMQWTASRHIPGSEAEDRGDRAAEMTGTLGGNRPVSF